MAKVGPTPPLGHPRQMVILDGPPEAPEPSRYLDYILITTTTINNNEWQAEIQPRHSAAQPVLRTLAGRRNSGAKRKKRKRNQQQTETSKKKDYKTITGYKPTMSIAGSCLGRCKPLVIKSPFCKFVSTWTNSISS